METTSLTFAHPAWFFALLVLPVLAGLYAWAWRRSDVLIARIVAVRLRAELAGSVHRGRRLFKALLLVVVLALIVVALARPQWGFVEREVKQRGRDIIIAVDTSRSMLATDVSPTRLARAKLVAQDLLELVQGDRVGLVAFAGSAFLQAPLTLDQSAVLVSLDELDTNVIPRGGTNIAAAIRDAEEAFGKGEGQTRALVILTDGEELDADGIAAAKKAGERGLRIFTVGIGSGEGSLIPLRKEDGTSDFVRDSAGKPVQSRLDERRLKEIAEASGGFYVPLGPDVAKSIFERGILPMEMTETGEMTSRQPIERFQWPLGAATALLALWMVLGDRRRTAAPRRVVKPATVAAALVLFAGPAMATGFQAYQAGDYQKALADFEQRLQQNPDSVALQYDAGAASYKLGEFGKAVDHFTKALLAEDQKLRENAAYNLGNALVRRGEGAQGPEEKKADWKNAIQHYTSALNLDPKNKKAEENREIVKKMLEDLEKQEQEQQQQQDQKDQKDQKEQKDQKDQKQNSQNQKQKDDQKKSDQQQQNQQQDQQGKEGENKDQKDDGSSGQNDPQNEKEKNEEQKGDKQNEEKDEQKNQDAKSQPKDEQGDQQEDRQQANNAPSSGDKNKPDEKPAPAPTPGEKKEGDLKPSQDQQSEPAGEGGQQDAEPAEKEGEMSAAQARSLLNSLRGEEERVRLMQRQDTEDTLKDW